MLTRFRQNVSQYPRLFAVWVVGCFAAIGGSYALARLVGIDAQHTMRLIAATLLVGFVLDGLLYRWIFRSGSRIAIFLDILNRFEGREILPLATDENEENWYDEEENQDEEENWEIW